MAITALSIPHDPTMRPACSWRSVFIDSAHTFWPVPHVELLLIIMARYHLNVLHWRLANDTAWRIPIPSFHLLTGARAQEPRPATDGHATSLRLGGGLAHPPHCAHGFYSEANIRHLVTYAAARDIRIIPEISFPTHTDAPIRTYPTYRCPDPRLSHDEQPEPRPLPHTHGRDGPTATYDSTPFEQAHQLHSRLPEAMSTERLRGVEALIHPTRITSSDPAFLHLLPHLLVTAEAAWHGSVTLPWKQLSPLIDNELTYLRHTVAYWKTLRT